MKVIGFITRAIGGVINRIIAMIKTIILAILVAMLVIMAPVAFVEFGCRSDSRQISYQPILSIENTRNLASTYLTYPEWHIVNAYDDYAEVISKGDPHEFKFLRAIEQFWSTSCLLTKTADRNGGASLATKSTIYVIGVSFTAETLLKAAYEETVGRLFAQLRGPQKSAVDIESAALARDYAVFLQQVPWYEYDFATDIEVLRDIPESTQRDKERRIALSLELAAKKTYAKLINGAVDATEQAKLTIRSVVSGLDAAKLSQIPEVTVIQTRPEGIEIETPRYRSFTFILQLIAFEGGEIIEIAGQDRIMVAVLANQPQFDGIVTLARQGYGDYRTLREVPMNELSTYIRTLDSDNEAELEHIFDY